LFFLHVGEARVKRGIWGIRRWRWFWRIRWWIIRWRRVFWKLVNLFFFPLFFFKRNHCLFRDFL
jgi:hypothetical protein